MRPIILNHNFKRLKNKLTLGGGLYLVYKLPNSKGLLIAFSPREASISETAFICAKKLFRTVCYRCPTSAF